MYYLTYNKQQTHPFYNVWQNDKGQYVVEVALAGYDAKHIKVRHDTQLRVDTFTGDQYTRLTVTAEKRTEKEYLVQGIANRNVSTGWHLPSGWEVAATTFENGILTIVLDTSKEQNAIKEFTF